MKNLGVYVSLFFLVFGGIIFWQSLSMDYYSDYGPGPGLLPRWVSGIIIVLSIVNLVWSFKKDVILFSDVMPKGEGLINVLTCMGSLVLFMVIVPFTGFVAGGITTLFILFKRGYKWYSALGLSALVTLVIFWLFGMALGIPLPVNQYGW